MSKFQNIKSQFTYMDTYMDMDTQIKVSNTGEFVKQTKLICPCHKEGGFVCRADGHCINM